MSCWVHHLDFSSESFVLVQVNLWAQATILNYKNLLVTVRLCATATVKHTLSLFPLLFSFLFSPLLSSSLKSTSQPDTNTHTSNSTQHTHKQCQEKHMSLHFSLSPQDPAQPHPKKGHHLLKNILLTAWVHDLRWPTEPHLATGLVVWAMHINFI